MRMMFRFRWIPFFAMLVAVSLGIALGQWQTRRAAQKLAIEVTMAERQAAPPLTLTAAQVAVDDIEYRRVRVAGEFARDWPLYLDNRPYQGRAGVVVLMPFKIAASDTHVLVARGWAARDAQERARMPVVATPSGTVLIEGVVRRSVGRVMQLGGAQPIQPGALLQNLDIGDLAAASKLKMEPFLIEQTISPAAGATPDHLIRDWPSPSSGIEKHRGYAVQWYGLALAAFLFFVVTGFKAGYQRGTK